jgi:hypothetical protein
MRNKKNELVFFKSITTISWAGPSFFIAYNCPYMDSSSFASNLYTDD